MYGWHFLYQRCLTSSTNKFSHGEKKKSKCSHVNIYCSCHRKSHSGWGRGGSCCFCPSAELYLMSCPWLWGCASRLLGATCRASCRYQMKPVGMSTAAADIQASCISNSGKKSFKNFMLFTCHTYELPTCKHIFYEIYIALPFFECSCPLITHWN